MPEKDPNHWLYRLSPDEWLHAAQNELLAARTAFMQRQQRSAVAHARRAAGMAWNALLWQCTDAEFAQRYGRSYMEHLQALSQDANFSEPLRTAAAKLLALPLTPELIPIGRHGPGRGDPSSADAAAVIIEYVRGLVLPPFSGAQPA